MRKRAEAPLIVCHACSLQVLGRGGDLEGWKAVQMDPAKAELRWFCMKPVCQYAYSMALQEAQEVWSAALPQHDQSEHDQSGDQAASDQARLHQQVREHLQRQEDMALSMDEDDVPPEPKEPPPMLLAYETSKVEEAGFKDEEFPYYRFADEKDEEPKPEPPKERERYVPTGSPRVEPRFIRHEGTGKKDE